MRAECSYSCQRNSFAGGDFASAPPQVIRGRRRKGEAESEQLGTAAGPSSLWRWIGWELLSLVPSSSCHPRSIPSSCDCPASPWLPSYWEQDLEESWTVPGDFGVHWNRAEVLLANVHYSSDLFKLTGIIWLLDQKDCDTISLFCTNSKSAALLPGLDVIFPTCTSSVFPSLGRYVKWNNKERSDCGYTWGLARTLCPVH